MEQVFDLREFILNIIKKYKLIIILAVILGIFGGFYGFISAGSDEFTTTTSASVNIISDKSTDATALTSIMTSIKETVTGDYFYMGILNAIRESVDNSDFNKIFEGQKQPSLASLKKIIKVYVNGNLVLLDVNVPDEALSLEASVVGRAYIIEQLGKNINNITLGERGEQTVNSSIQNGSTPKGKAIKYGILGAGAGFVIGILFIFFVDIMSLKIKTSDELKKYSMPILGEITKDRG